MARKVILFVAQTLDGYIAETDGNIDFLSDEDVAMGEIEDREYDKMIRHIDTVVMGRTTYDQVVNELSPDNYPYADFDNYIMTSHPLEDFDNVHFVNGDVVELVQKLKEQPSRKDIWIVGGSKVIAPLVTNNLVDIFRIGIVPIILGKGIPLFLDNVRHKGLNLKSVKKVNGIAYLEYQRWLNLAMLTKSKCKEWH